MDVVKEGNRVSQQWSWFGWFELFLKKEAWPCPPVLRDTSLALGCLAGPIYLFTKQMLTEHLLYARHRVSGRVVPRSLGRRLWMTLVDLGRQKETYFELHTFQHIHLYAFRLVGVQVGFLN